MTVTTTLKTSDLTEIVVSGQKLMPGTEFPDIRVPTLNGDSVSLGQPAVDFDWRMVVVYRGKHCPLCTGYLNQLQKLKDKLYQIGIDVVAVSADSKQQLLSHVEQLEVDFPLAYGLSIDQMRKLGVYISEPRSALETDHPFSEPGLFVINDQGQVQVLDISNGPFARPELETLISGLAFIRDPGNKYPIRGAFYP